MLADIMLALAYASIGLAPLVYSYLAVREEEREVARRRAKAMAAEEPKVDVHVVVVVRGDEVSMERVEGEPLAPVLGGEDAVVLQGPSIEGVGSTTSEGLEASLA